MKIRYDIIAFWSAVGLAVLFACLIAVWRGFSIFTGLAMLAASVIFTYWNYKKLRTFKDRLYEKRYEDAYTYADENNTSFNPEYYQYSKKEEKQFTAYERNLKTFVYTGIVLSVASIVLVVFGFIIVL